MTRILGIDPGSRITGFGVIEVINRRVRYVTSGCLRVEGDGLPLRLKSIFEGISEVVCEYSPDEMAIEKVFVQRNVDSALKLGQARGAAICATVMQSLSVAEYSATQIKKAVVGKGHANKEQVQFMVRTLLSLSAAPQQDAADALACALCHNQMRELPSKISAKRVAALPLQRALS